MLWTMQCKSLFTSVRNAPYTVRSVLIWDTTVKDATSFYTYIAELEKIAMK